MTRALVIVAHPDDETIWMGGTILMHPAWEWTIVSLCRKDDTDRAPKFMRVCASYGAKGIISDLDDEKLEPLSTREVVDKIKSLVPQGSYDVIYTHGKRGEYGHMRHKEVHKAVVDLLKNKYLISKKIFYFAYVASTVPSSHDSNVMIHIADAKAIEQVRLSADNLKKKQSLIRDVYGFAENSFEFVSCKSLEAFDKQ